MNYKENKIIFNYILEHKYSIIKDNESNNILYIKYGNKEIKCKYLLLFTQQNNSSIIWSCDNPYIDQKTKNIIMIIKNLIMKKFTFNNVINTNEYYQILKYILNELKFIVFQEEKINFLWILKGIIKNYNHFYIINEIISL